MKKLLLAFHFLTIIPFGKTDNMSEEDIGGTSVFFPIVGAVQGIFFVISSVLLLKVLPAEVVNVLVILLMIIINGGLHLDGLADTFDAIASRKDKEKKLAVMKDSAVGPFGVMAILFSIFLKYLLLNALFSNSLLITYYSSLFLMPLFSRWAMAAALFHAKPARRDGLGRIFIAHTGVKELLTAAGFVLFISLVAIFAVRQSFQLSAVSYQLLFVLPVLYVFVLTSVWFCGKTFGGMTGDTFGAVSELSEILFLMTAVIWSRNFTL
ncbi:MAG: adenosylcobinamide-GDP ribazoletransferase [Nitrospirae bacterium]|nr:adenosylcobinamide-GDP ribazoletransferase [Nitrospirota bacterium]